MMVVASMLEDAAGQIVAFISWLGRMLEYKSGYRQLAFQPLSVAVGHTRQGEPVLPSLLRQKQKLYKVP